MIHLTVQDGGHRYGYRRIFSGVNLELSSGEILAITGANGSGKSTLLKALGGILRLTSGKVELILSEQVISREQHALHIGFVAPYVNLYEDLTLQENLAFIERARSMRSDSMRIESTVADVGLTAHMDEPIRTYSTGMQQRVRLAAALFHEPKVFLLDEPTLGLDPKGKEIFKNMVARSRESGHLVVIASNSEDEIAMATQSLCIEDYAPNTRRFISSSSK